MTDITWMPHIPLIGGFPLGAEMAFKTPPQAIYSYDGFQDNDQHYVNWQQNTLGRKDVEYIPMKETSEVRHRADVIVGTPPCAALSQLNTGSSAEAKGASCAKNDWMYRVFEDGIDLMGAKVVIVENAPALFTNKGQPVADRLFEICKARGWSMSLYKTSTMYHGIPQNRDRTFAIGWQADRAPVMGWYDRDRKNLKSYLKEVKKGDLHHELVINPKVIDEPYFNFIKVKTNRDPRELLIEADIKTTLNYVNDMGWMSEANKWFHDTNNAAGIKYSDHAIKKYADGKGVWDGSVHVFGEYMNAVIGRNMADTIHPTLDRSLTVREALHLMGFPKDFELLTGLRRLNHVAQNVPTCTARDMCLEIAKFLNGELPESDTNYFRQNNHNKKTWSDPNGTVNRASLEEFFA